MIPIFELLFFLLPASTVTDPSRADKVGLPREDFGRSRIVILDSELSAWQLWSSGNEADTSNWRDQVRDVVDDRERRKIVHKCAR